jgi:predicted negative regulator of RcsB-dependent stress response
MTVTTIIQDYGFPIVAVFFLAYFIYFLWKFITTEITPKLASTSATLIKLIDRVRMMDNDLIRLETKLKTLSKKKKK